MLETANNARTFSIAGARLSLRTLPDSRSAYPTWVSNRASVAATRSASSLPIFIHLPPARCHSSRQIRPKAARWCVIAITSRDGR